MKILAFSGSPRKKGNSARLLDAFCRGAEEAGHEVLFFDVAHMNIHACLACNACRKDGGCFQQDGMQEIYPHLVEADAIVLATPLYYFGMSAQLKLVIDRFYGVNEALRAHPKQAVLLAACGDAEDEAMDVLLAHYQALCSYCHWLDRGRALAIGVYDIGAVEGLPCLQEAYELGKNL